MDEEKKEPVNQQDEHKDEWVCPKCGHTNKGNFCGNCGAPKPAETEDKPSSSNETVNTADQKVSADSTASEQKTAEAAEPKTAAAPKKPAEKKPVDHAGKAKHRKVIAGICEAVLVFAVGFGGGWLGSSVSTSKKIDDLEDEVSDLKDDVEKLQDENSLLDGIEGFFGGRGGSSDHNDENGKGGLFGDYSENGQDKDDDSSKDDKGSSDDEAEEQGAALGLIVQETNDGVEVVGFSNNSKAEDAGIQSGDIIKKLDGQDASTYEKIQSFLSGKNAGDTVTITVERNGKEVEEQLTLVEKQNSNFKLTVPDAGKA